MKLQTISLVLLSTVAIVEARCNKDGDWGMSKLQVEAFVNTACDELATYYDPNETKYLCYQYDKDASAEFAITWKGKGRWPLAKKDCRGRMYNEIRGCQTGGTSTVADWQIG